MTQPVPQWKDIPGDPHPAPDPGPVVEPPPSDNGDDE